MNYEKEDQGEAFSSVDLVAQCLIDEPRTNFFKKIIEQVVDSTKTVIDIGTGSGVMAMFATKAGAKKVYAMEFDPFIAKTAIHNFKINNFEDKISLLQGDARSFNFPEGVFFDVVIMEMLTTAMVDEYQVKAINNLLDKKVVDQNTIFIPKRQDSFVSLVNTNYELYGLKFPMIKHLWNNLSENQNVTKISSQEVLNQINFFEFNNEKFEKDIEFTIEQDGVINGLYITSLLYLTDTEILKDTETLNAPVLFPIPEREVKSGDRVVYKVTYTFGGGYENFKIDIIL